MRPSRRARVTTDRCSMRRCAGISVGADAKPRLRTDCGSVFLWRCWKGRLSAPQERPCGSASARRAPPSPLAVTQAVRTNSRAGRRIGQAPLRCLSLPLLARGGRHHQVTTRSLCSPHRQSPLRFGSFRRSPIHAWLECAQMRPQVGQTKASQTGSSLPGSATRHRRNHTGVHRSRLSIRFQLR